MVKPDGVMEGRVGEVIKRFEKAGFRLKAIKVMTADQELLRKHYSEHVSKPFYKGLEKFIMEGPVVPMVLEKDNAVQDLRTLIGAKKELV